MFCSSPPVGGPLAAPPFGHVLVDVCVVVLIDAGVLDTGGKALSTVPIPASATTLIGTQFVLQAVVDAAAGPRLTNARKARVEGY